MKNDARKLSTKEQDLIRKLAVQRVFDGESAAEVTRSFGLGGDPRQQGFDFGLWTMSYTLK